MLILRRDVLSLAMATAVVLISSFVVWHMVKKSGFALSKQEKAKTGFNIVDNVAAFSCHHKAAIILCGVMAAALLAIFFVVTNDVLSPRGHDATPMRVEGNWRALLYCFSCYVLLAIVLFGLVYADHTKKDILACYRILDDLNRLGLQDVAKVGRRFRAALSSSQSEANHKEKGYYRWCRRSYFACWYVLTLAVALFCVADLDLPFDHATVLRLLIILALGFNCHSFLACCLLVWMLRELSNASGIAKANYVRKKPELTPFYQELVRITSHNTVAFLLVSLALSVVALLAVALVPGSPSVASLLSLLTANVIGIIGFFVLFIGSKVFLGKILGIWRRQETEKWIEVQNNRGAKKREAIDPVKMYAPDPMSMADRASILIAAMDVVISAAALLPAVGLFG